MVTSTLMYGRKYQQGVNVITVVAMTAFHILSVAAFFYIDFGAIAERPTTRPATRPTTTPAGRGRITVGPDTGNR